MKQKALFPLNRLYDYGEVNWNGGIKQPMENDPASPPPRPHTSRLSCSHSSIPVVSPFLPRLR